MKIHLILFASFLAAGFFSSLRAQALVKEEPIYDTEGHLTSYKYADGSHDLYCYDTNWRLTSFVDRNGKITQYSYLADGSMVASKPD